jgi:hypothetical protein
MVNNVIRFNCGNAVIEFGVESLTRPDAFRQTLEKTSIVDIAYIHEGHGHLLQIGRDYRSRDTTSPADVYYNTRGSGKGRQIGYECKICSSKFMFTIPEAKTDQGYECFHIIQKGYERLHYLWLSNQSTVKLARHMDFFIRESEL